MLADTAPATPAPGHSVTTNVNLVPDYYFRGIDQTSDPAHYGGGSLHTRLPGSHVDYEFMPTWTLNPHAARTQAKGALVCPSECDGDYPVAIKPQPDLRSGGAGALDVYRVLTPRRPIFTAF